MSHAVIAPPAPANSVRRPRVSRTAAAPTPEQLAAFRRLITPDIRSGCLADLAFRPEPLVGDVLDIKPPGECYVRSRSYSAKKQTAWVFWKRCGYRSCPFCVVGWIEDLVAPSWAYWGGRAAWESLDDQNAERRWRARRPEIRVQGPNATPGVLSLPVRYRGRRVVFYPDAAPLDESILVYAIRVMPVRFTEAQKDGWSIYRGTYPSYVSDSVIVESARAAGFEFRGSRVKTATGVTPEEYTAHLESVR